MNRTMTRVLAEELDRLTAADRRTIERLADTEGLSPLLTRFLRALATQVHVDRCREDAVVHAMEAQHHADVEAIDRQVNGDPEPVQGRPATFDPSTGQLTLD